MRTLIDGRAGKCFNQPQQRKPMRLVLDPEKCPNKLESFATHALLMNCNQLKAKNVELEAERHQKELERDLYSATSNALDALVATLQERVDMRASLARTGQARGQT